jgi:hypothetical protein
VSIELIEILDFDDWLHEEFSAAGDSFMPVLKGSSFPITMQSLIGLMASTNSIKLGVYDLVEHCDTHLYVVKILHRTLLEQFLRFEYVCQKFLDEKSEDVGIEYRKYSKISEILSYLSASNVSAKMAGKSTNEIILKKLKKEYPEMNVSRKNLDEITRKWKHRNIIRYLTSRGNSSKEGDHSFLIGMIPEYAELSSFVHGGASAEEYYHEIFESGKLKEEMVLMAAKACIISAMVKSHLLCVVANIDSSFKENRDMIMSKTVEFASRLHNNSMQPTADASAD